MLQSRICPAVFILINNSQSENYLVAKHVSTFSFIIFLNIRNNIKKIEGKKVFL